MMMIGVRRRGRHTAKVVALARGDDTSAGTRDEGVPALVAEAVEVCRRATSGLSTALETGDGACR